MIQEKKQWSIKVEKIKNNWIFEISISSLKITTVMMYLENNYKIFYTNLELLRYYFAVS